MAKTKRGRNVMKILNWRGTCPICSRSGVELLWDRVSENGTIKVSKICGK